MSDRDTNNQAAYLLHWLRDAGADAVVGDAPIDWLARGDLAPGHAFKRPHPAHKTFDTPGGRTEAPRLRSGHAGGQAPFAAPRQGSTPAASPVARRPQTPLASRDAENEGRRAAEQAKTLEDLEIALKSFDGCTLRATAKNLCFYRGAAQARIMFVGEAPGRDEDIAGKPFVGRAGQLLDKMYASIGLDEASVHITNVVYWRPPGNRTPTPQETLACRPFLEKQIELVDPEIIIALGGSAAKELFSMQEGIMKLRGKWRDCQLGGAQRRALATLHPAYLLRTPAAKQLVWRDLLAIKSLIESSS